MDRRRRQRCEEACITCKRRKERCCGNKPCARCIERGVEAACVFRARIDRNNSQCQPAAQDVRNIGGFVQDTMTPQDQTAGNDDGRLSMVASNTSSTSVPDNSRLIMDTKGKYMFIGDSANLSLLQQIRNHVQSCIGSCPFVEDPLRYQMVESVTTGSASWLYAAERPPPPKPSVSEATYLIRWYSFATNCVLDLFDEKDLLNNLPAWLETSPAEGMPVLSAIYYLVFALGAQTCPEDKDTLASLYFDYGRYLTASYFTEDPSISTIQTYAMITMYMLCDARRNAAFMYLGTAVRAAYALGLHRHDISSLFAPSENQTRERLWKVMRILDLFMSASMGRPPSTAETRNTELKENYSASNDLCAIFEKILTDMYAKRMVSTQVVEQISRHHRRWTMRFREGLSTDRIEDDDFVDGHRPNIGLLHIKEAYYWTIILLARPFFMESISNHITLKSSSALDGQSTPGLSSSSHQILVHACISSATSTIDLLKILLKVKGIPQRLPFIVNSLFVSGLILGLSYFGNWYKTYPLTDSLDTCLKLLALFPGDAIAKRNMAILELLRNACTVYMKQQANDNENRQRNLVFGMFGRMDGTRLNERPSESNSAVHTGQFQQNAANFSLELPYEASETRLSHTPLATSTTGFVTIEVHGKSAGDLDPFDPNSPTSGYLAAPIMSPRTLWFDSYEHNMPLFSIIDTRGFLS